MEWTLPENPDYLDVLQIPYPDEESIVKNVLAEC